jgi:hypothetical protein
MERKALHRLLVLAVFVLTPLGLNSQLAVAADTDDDQRPRIAPIQTKPEGQTYGRRGVAMGARDPGRREPAYRYDGRRL